MTNITKQQALTDAEIEELAEGYMRNAAGGIYSTRVVDFARSIESSVLARQGVGSDAEWRDIETAPKDGRTLLLGYFNGNGKWRTLRGQWFSDEEIAETWEEPDDCEAGWYETSVECDMPPNCWKTEPTHWMPLLPAPGSLMKAPTPPLKEE